MTNTWVDSLGGVVVRPALNLSHQKTNTNNPLVVVARDVVVGMPFSIPFRPGFDSQHCQFSELPLAEWFSQCYDLLTNRVEAFGGSIPLYGHIFFPPFSCLFDQTSAALKLTLL